MSRKNKPESEMMGSAYDPHLSEGSAKVNYHHALNKLKKWVRDD